MGVRLNWGYKLVILSISRRCLYKNAHCIGRFTQFGAFFEETKNILFHDHIIIREITK
jgi:hypothetical protein